MPDQLRSGSFHESELIKIGGPYPWPAPPIVGDAVELNSGGPRMLILEMDGDHAICDWEGSAGECRFSWVCLKPWREVEAGSA